MLHYYVYYRVAPDSVGEAEAATEVILRTLEAEVGVSGRLLKKRDEPLLWMEVYENVPADEPFETRLAHACDRAGLAAHLSGTRHVECFSD